MVLLALGVLVGYIIIGTILAVASRRYLRGVSEKEIFIAGGRMGGFLSALTYAATTYSAFMIVGLVGFTYDWGVGSFGFEITYFVATVGLLVAFAPRVWRMARKRGWVSPGEMLADLYGSRWLAVIASLIYLVALIPYASAQVKGIGDAFAGLAGEDAYILGVGLALVVMLVWSLVAGIWSVAVTDAFQGLWMLAAATGLLAWLYLKLAGSGLGLGEATGILASEGLLGLEGYWPPAKFLAFTLPWIFFAVTNPQVVQRLYIPRDEASLARMVRWFAVFGLYYTVLVTLIGLLARAGVEAGLLPEPPSRDAVTPTLLSLTHPLLAAVVFTSIVAAAVSTADSILLTLASSVSRDLGWMVEEKRRRALAVAAVLLVAVAMAGVAAARVGYIVGLSVLSSVMLLSLAPATIAAWAGYKAHPLAAAASIVSGFTLVAALIVYYRNPLAVFTATPLGLPVAAWVLTVSTLIVLIGVMARRT
ncbi:MAG: sodium:solute symporter family protein [Desulfurococcales archaeon]|nr:sodium:solute symporter family protein [Desulfurococcales archaeon]